MKKFTYFILIIIFIIFIIEIISFSLSKLELLNFNQTPKIYQSKKYDDFDKYWNEKNLWGSWHGKNITVRHTKPCFDVIYKTNKIGARDDNFIKNKKKKLILLGDSFAEGFGVSKQFIFENYLEKKPNTMY